MTNTKLFTILGFILLGIFSRFIPHPPNMTALNSVALFAGCCLGFSVYLSLGIVFLIMFLSDLICGLHSTLLYVYFSLGSVVLLGHWLKGQMSIGRTIFLLIASSFIFFFITNFGVWMASSMYSKTFSGLAACYVAAIPFIANQIVGDLIYGLILFGCFAFVEKRFLSACFSE